MSVTHSILIHNDPVLGPIVWKRYAIDSGLQSVLEYLCMYSMRLEYMKQLPPVRVYNAMETGHGKCLLTLDATDLENREQ